MSELGSVYPVVWYVGQTIDHGAEVVVMFEADLPGGPELIVGHAQSASVMHNQPAWSDGVSPWTLTVIPAPSPGRPPAAIGEYVPAPAGVAGSNWVVLLTAPGVRSVNWSMATTGGTRRSTVRTPDGLAVAYVSQLTSRVTLTGLSTSRGFDPLRNVPVGIPGAHGAMTPSLAAPQSAR